MNTDKIYAEAVANEYAKKDASKVVALKKLDRHAKLPALIFAYTFGVVFTLLLGVGMCFSLDVFENNSTGLFAMGIVLGILGIVGITVNYPIYNKILARGKEKYGPDILQLAKEISEEE